MVGGLVPAAHMLVDLRLDEAIGGLWRQQQMIDADAVVLLPGASLIIPKGVEASRIAAGADRVGQAEAQKRAEFGAGARQVERIAFPDRGITRIKRRGDHVVVTRQKQRLLPLEAFTSVVNKPVHPADFIRIFVSAR